VRGNRFVSLWHHAEQSARACWIACCLEAGLAVLSLTVAIKLINRPREVVRVGCDGIPALLKIDEPRNSEPDEREIRAFATAFATFYVRRDSYSIVNDFAWCAARMAPELRDKFKAFARGQPGQPSLISKIERLQQRTEVDSSSLEISVDQRVYPWRATVRGVVHVISAAPTAEQRFELELELVRTSREELIEGLLVWPLKTRGMFGQETLDRTS